MADHDDLKNPIPHDAPKKSVVDSVIDLAIKSSSGIVSLLSGLLAAVLILYSSYVLYDTLNTQQRAASSAWDLLQYKPEIIDDYDTALAFGGLEQINSDYRAWLTVYDTSIDYPVVQGLDDLYYSSHDVYGKSSLTGAIYLAAANSPNFSDSYNLIYGHHMDNSAMFGSLDAFKGEDYFNAHRTGIIVTKTGAFDIEFFAVLSTDAYESRIYSVGNRASDVKDFIASGGAGGVGVGTTVLKYDAAVAADATKLIALSTCANAETSGRLVVIGKLTEHVVLTDVTVAKVWDDANNQDGMRPASLTVTLSNGDQVVLDEDHEWTAAVSVPKYENYQEIEYTWTEENVEGYTQTGYDTEENKTTLTNTHIPETVSLTVTKAWNDDNNRDGIRPEGIVATLSNGTAVTLNEENHWTATVDNLPVYQNGEAIVYTWTETVPDGYTVSQSTEDKTTTLTNTHEIETMSITVNKVWNDANNQDGIRPASVTASLYGDDALIQAVQLNETNGWSATINDLPVNDHGKAIAYRWTENEVTGYTTEINGNTITNTHTPETVDLTVSKVWDDNDNQDGIRPNSVRVTLSNGRSVTLTATENWTATITGLPKNANGQEISYEWTEAELRGYELTSNVTTGNSTVLTNRHETDTTVATVIKVWNDDDDRDGIRPDHVTVSLSNGEERVLNAENNWTATITGLPVNADGQPIVYTWAEEAMDGYTSTSALEGTTTTITNTHVPATTALTVTKVWDDDDNRDGIRPESVTAVLSTGETVVLNEKNNWTATADGLFVNENGNPLTYTWSEQAVTGYTASAATQGTVTTLTNSHTPAVTSRTVTKVWDDNNNQDGIRPDRLTVTLSDGQFVTLDAENAWTATIRDLPVYENGEEIVYTWTEEEAEGYTLNSSAEEYGVTTLTNIHEPETMDFTVVKVWDDDDNRDGLRPASLVLALHVNNSPVRYATLNEANEWTATVQNLPVYADGIAINYQWVEEAVAGYTASAVRENGVTILTNTHTPATTTQVVVKSWDDDNDRDKMRPDSLSVTLTANGADVTTVTLTAPDWTGTVENIPLNANGEQITYAWREESFEGYELSNTVRDANVTTLTNTHIPATTYIGIVKQWDDAGNQDGIRPESIVFTLYADGEAIEAVTLSAENEWTYTFEGLPQNKDGAIIQYTWSEPELNGYNQVNVSRLQHLSWFTNRHIPETTAVTVTKIWDDNENRDGMRPDSLTLTLLANGEEDRSVTLSAAENWTSTVTGLPKYANGVEIAYTWAEGEIEGYEPVSNVTTGTSTVITNRHETANTVATVIKVWDDANDQDGLRPGMLTLALTADGTPVQNVTLTPETNWTASVEGLPLNNNGVPIVYAWTEPAVAGYVSASTADGTTTTITNTHTPATAACSITKEWDDNNDSDGLRPASLTVTLNANGAAVRTVTLTSANNWSAAIDNLPAYADGARVNYTWTEPAIPGYTLANTSTVTTAAGVAATTITNTHTPETVDLTVRKVWVDTDDSDRPAAINMVLTGSTGEIRMVTLSAAAGWTATLTDLPRYADGAEIAYAWTEPAVAGYTQTSAVTTGTTTIFTNTRVLPDNPPVDYTLTVYYRYLDGSIAAPTYIGTYREGEPYDVISPVIPGYRATLLRVTGIMPARNVEYTVIYLPIDDTIIIEEIDTPLGLGQGQVFLNIDDCLD